MDIVKNIILNVHSGYGGSSQIRSLIPFDYINSMVGHTQSLQVISTPVPIYDESLFVNTRAVYIQRHSDPRILQYIYRLKEASKKFSFRLIYEIDDMFLKIDKESIIPDYNVAKKYVTDDMISTAIKIMNMCDLVIASTPILSKLLKDVVGIRPQVKVVQNVVPKYLFDYYGAKTVKKNIGKARVVYTGSTSHINNDERLLGDWSEVWSEWLRQKIKDNEIDMYIFSSRLPFFLEGLEKKVNLIPWSPSVYKFYMQLKNIRPHFGMAPLKSNLFNACRSSIKMHEYTAVGAITFGSVFDEYASPYDQCTVKVPLDASETFFNEQLEYYKQKDNFNSAINGQFADMEDHHWWLEDPVHINKMLSYL